MLNPAIYPNLPYDTVKDLTGVMPLVVLPMTGVMGGRTDFFFAPLLATLPMIMRPQQFNAFIRTEMESAARIAHTASLKAQ